MRPYQYRCNDYSLLTPPFKKWIISPLIHIVPWIVPANIITLISNFFVYLGLYLSIHPTWAGEYSPLYIAACLLMYLIGDHLDGMQAKRTLTGSALGEFCDHYLDAFNNGVIVFTMLTVFDVLQPAIVSGVIVVSYLAHMAVFYEQFKTGWLTFERIGSLEGVLLSALLIGLSIIDPVHTLLTHKIAGEFTLAEGIILSTALGALATFVQTFKRTPEVKRGYWIFSFLLIMIGFVCIFLFTNFQLFIILTLYASLYIGKIMYGHLIDGIESQPDWITPAILCLYYLSGLYYTDYIFWMLIAYLSLRIIVLVVKTFFALKVFWVWQNARI
jgi:phosphatidylglycerophosphate synthase